MIVTVAIPCYKSKKTIGTVVSDVRTAILQRPGNDYRIILVNDYPGDGTFDVIRRLCAEDEKIIGVDLTKNFGQASAKLAALRYFDGDVLVYMDDDGQHPADEIYKLVDKVFEGYDVVYGYFRHKKHSIFKRAASSLNSLLSEFNGSKPKGIRISSFLAISKTAADALREYDSPFPSIGGYLNNVVDKYANVEVTHKERIEGRSNYTFGKLIRMWFTGFTNFSLMPIKCVLYLGMLVSVLGFIFGLIVIVRKLIDPSMMPGYASTTALILFFSGIIMFSLGFIGEYVGRIYMTVSRMQQYKIRETINCKKSGRCKEEAGNEQ
ncbi:MAG: glycosyltransferase [Clostridia bacterium]|nr:glycosyltransferase [Clostridia bacterium]